VQDRFIQQLLLQAMTPIYEPNFSDHSYGFRPGRNAHRAVAAAQGHAREGRDWVVDIDIAKFFDHVNHDILMGRIGQVIRDKRVLGLIGKFLRRGAMVGGLVEASVEGTPQAGRYRRCWRTSIWMRSTGNWRGAGIGSAGTRMTAIST
jgi:retron-type reverse transcriptase